MARVLQQGADGGKHGEGSGKGHSPADDGGRKQHGSKKTTVITRIVMVITALAPIVIGVKV